jgi:hypothetical protein
MKRTLIFLAFNVVMIVVTALVAVSCNPDVFIKPLDVSEAEFDVPFYGGSVEVQVSHGDWELERVSYNYIDLGFVEDADGVLWHEDNFIRLHVSRQQPSKLWVTVDDSVNPEAALIHIYIRNDYESEVVTVNVGACSGYSFSRIEYGDVQMVSSEDAYEEGWRKSVSVSSAQSQSFDVFGGGASRTVFFPAATVVSEDMPYAAWYDTLMQYVDGGAFDVPVPDALPGSGGLVFSGEEVEFGYTPVQMAMPELGLGETAAVNLAPGVNEVRMMWGYVEYRVPYVITFAHSGEGRDLTLRGEFTSKAHNGKWRVEL